MSKKSKDEKCCEDGIMPCINFKTSNSSVDITPKDKFDFSKAIENIYPLTDIICSYLQYSDLENISELSEIWKSSAEKESNKRNGPTWISGCRKGKHEITELFKNVNSFYFNRKGTAIFFLHPKEIKLDRYICMHKNNGTKSRMTFMEFLSNEIIEDKTETCFITDMGVSLIEKPSKEMKEYFGGIFFPEIKNIRISQFYFCDHKASNLDDIIKYNETLECLLILSMKDSRRVLAKLMKNIEARQEQPIALGGGIFHGVQSTVVKPRVIKTTDLYCIGFLSNTESNEFYSGSIVINQEDNFAETLIKFKGGIIKREYSVIFRFCCNGKEDAEIEDPLLREHFPGTILMQFDVMGEIGTTFYQPQDRTSSPQSKKRRTSGTHYHAFTSILVYISWGKIKN